MKHKAQEALNNYCQIGCIKKGLSSEEQEAPTKTIQQLIDTYLTLDELDILCSCVSDALAESTMANDLETTVFLNDMLNKLKNQKEMWCEDE